MEFIFGREFDSPRLHQYDVKLELLVQVVIDLLTRNS